MSDPQHIETLIAQNAELLEQNRQLMALMQDRAFAASIVPAPPKKRTSKKQEAKREITLWFLYIEPTLSKKMAAILKRNLQSKRLWLD